MRYIICSIVILLLSAGFSHADDPRFSRILEFELMSKCTSEIVHRDVTEVCACALYAAQESPWFSDYNNDGDFNDNMQKFLEILEEKTKYYSINGQKCKRR
jgi:hypothetical protein